MFLLRLAARGGGATSLPAALRPLPAAAAVGRRGAAEAAAGLRALQLASPEALERICRAAESAARHRGSAAAAAAAASDEASQQAPGGGGGENSGSSNGSSGGSLVDPVDVIPSRLVVFPNYNRPLFPGLVSAHSVLDDGMWEELVNTWQKGSKMVGVFYTKKGPHGEPNTSESVPGAAATGFQTDGPARNPMAAATGGEQRYEPVRAIGDVHKVGVAARIIRLIPGPGRSGNTVYLVGRKRVVAESEWSTSPRLVVNVSPLNELPFDAKDVAVKASVMEIYRYIKELVKLNPFFKEQLQTLVDMTDVGKPAELADMSAALTTSDGEQLQQILETLDVPQRLRHSLQLLKKEHDITELQQSINKEIEQKFSEKQKQFFLREQLKVIKKELGIEKDEKEDLVTTLNERVSKLKLPAEAQRVFNDEMKKIQFLEPSSSEYNISRNYLDWLTMLPWGVHTSDNFNIRRAERILNRDHYGLEDVKKRILEFIAVGSLRGEVQGKILLFTGPPGVGKTSLGKSIAAALNRKFFRFSVGGMNDVSEIKGHRRTYIGSMPGKLMQALRKVQSSNPVLMIDEIDKLGVSYQGDPAAALLEVLDPEQNSSFNDHYVDTPYDLSKVLFVCTSNTTETIARPLLDRMETIALSGYVADEKIYIAQKYLIPQLRNETGLTASDIVVPRTALETMVKGYAREAGVRNLRQLLEKVHRKVALESVLASQRGGRASSSKGKAAAAASDDSASGNSAEATPVSDAATPASDDDGDDADGAAAATADAAEGGSSKGGRRRTSKGAAAPVVISATRLEKYLGKPVFTKDRIYDRTPAGVVMGLAWTQMGGSTLFIETINNSTPGGGGSGDARFEMSGRLGDVMKESGRIAVHFSRNFVSRLQPHNRFFEGAQLHLHVPEGAVPKDGPSAGCTMVTSLVSLALDKPVADDVAMTGEITLTGKVLSIGGVKEKLLAARRAGAKHIVLPRDNERDVEELSSNITEGLNFFYAAEYQDVYDVAFGDAIEKRLKRAARAARKTDSATTKRAEAAAS